MFDVRSRIWLFWRLPCCTCWTAAAVRVQRAQWSFLRHNIPIRTSKCLAVTVSFCNLVLWAINLYWYLVHVKEPKANCTTRRRLFGFMNSCRVDNALEREDSDDIAYYTWLPMFQNTSLYGGLYWNWITWFKHISTLSTVDSWGVVIARKWYVLYKYLSLSFLSVF